MKRFSAESIFRDKSLKGNTMNSDEGMKLSFVEDSVQVSNDMDKAIFHCRLEGESQIQPCELLQLSVQCTLHTLHIYLMEVTFSALIILYTYVVTYSLIHIILILLLVYDVLKYVHWAQYYPVHMAIAVFIF